ncbi:MAG: ferritin-like domain-containing protein [Crinalium sp.]
MKNILALVVNWAIANVQSAHKFLNHIISRIGNAIAAIVPANIALLILPAIFISLFTNPAPAYAQSARLTPRQVVEYALTLEKLEADFYRRANNEVANGRLANIPQIAKDALVSYGEDEASHVADLSPILTSLGGNPDAVTIPQNPNYNAILGRDPFANAADLLLAGQFVEDLGAAAYKGQVQNLLAAGEAAKPVLAGALAIHSVEARHAAGIRTLRQTLLGSNVRPWIRNASEVIYKENRSGSPIPFNSEAFDGYATRDEVLALVSPILRVSQQPRSNQSNSTSPNRSRQSNPVRALW